MNKQEIERAIKYWKEFKEEIPELKKSYPDAGLDEQEECVDMAIFALTQQLTNGWIPVSERLPVSEKRVLICADRKYLDGSIIQIRTIAMYEDGAMHTRESGFMWEEDIDFEYDEETDDFIIPEGWREQSMYCEEFSKVDDFVTHWMPLPETYKE